MDYLKFINQKIKIYPLRPVIGIIDTIDIIFANYINYKLKLIIQNYINTYIKDSDNLRQLLIEL